MRYFLDTEFHPVNGILNAEESRHAIKSLRVKIGDTISIGNGQGQRHRAEIFSIGKDKVEVRVLNTELIEKPKQMLTIAMAPTKNISRFEWFLEKATEMGIGGIVPMLTKRTERPRLKQDRAERIAHAAAKQSLQPYIPELAELTPFEEIIKTDAEAKFIAHCEADQERTSVSDAINSFDSDGECLILIGPEGDFTPEEIEIAKAAGFTPIDLGAHRLRTETAGVFCAAVWLCGK